jgi:hypothetical protein
MISKKHGLDSDEKEGKKIHKEELITKYKNIISPGIMKLMSLDSPLFGCIERIVIPAN